MEKRIDKKQTHKTPYILAALAFVIALPAAIAGIAMKDTIYNAAAVNERAANDIVTAAILLPILLAGIILAGRGKKQGAFIMSAGLYALAYGYIPYIFDAGSPVMLICYLAIVAIGICAMVAHVASYDWQIGGDFFHSRAKNTITGILLLALGVFVIAFQAADIFTQSLADTSAAQLALYFADFVLAAPMLLASGIMVLVKKRLGYIIGFSILLGYLLQCVTLIPFFFIQAGMDGVPVDTDSVFAIFAMILICIAPVCFFMGGLKKMGGKKK